MLTAAAAMGRPAGHRAKRAPRRWSRGALIAALVLVLWPPALILPLWLFDPPITSFILGEAIERVRADESPWWPRRTVVPRERVSPMLVRAVLAAEDDAFYLHPGFDIRQIEDALSGDGTKSRGASTITQQTAKNLFLWSGRSYVRKAIEAYVSVWLELCLSKDRILEIYLNLVECGDGAFGVEACAQLHFGRSARDLGPEQSARLAAILPSPKRWSPHGSYAGRRVRELLQRMAVPIAR